MTFRYGKAVEDIFSQLGLIKTILLWAKLLCKTRWLIRLKYRWKAMLKTQIAIPRLFHVIGRADRKGMNPLIRFMEAQPFSFH